MEDDYMETQDVEIPNRNTSETDSIGDAAKDFGEGGFDEGYEEDEGNSFRGNRGRGNFRNRGRGGMPPPNWMNGPPPMRFRGRGYGPGGPPMRGRGFFRGRGGPRGYNNGPNFDNNWGPMGPPPPGMMGGPPPFGPPPGMMGPPPNMMGQPPPFSGPPQMPPPNMASEIWVETKCDDGKSYYYHSRTRETTWTRPAESLACRVVTQQEMEAMAVAGQLPGNSIIGNSMPTGGMGGPPSSGPPPFMPTPPPWLKEGAGMSDKDNRDGSDDEDHMDQNANQPNNGGMMPFQGPPGTGPGPMAPSGPMGPPGPMAPWAWGWPPPMNQPPMNQPPMSQPAMSQSPMSQPLMSQPPMSQPGLSQPPQLSQMASLSQPPQLMQNPMTQATPAGIQPRPAGMTPQLSAGDSSSSPAPASTNKDELAIPAEVVSAAAEWSGHRAPDGRLYYYNEGKQHSVWEKPPAMLLLEEWKAKLSMDKMEKPEKKFPKMEIDDSKIEVIDVDAHAEAAADNERRAADERAARERAEKELAEKEAENKEKEKEKAKQDRSRPISTTPISGTPWCVVWTGDGMVFFYNPSARLSVWERPALLAGRADVDRAVASPPNTAITKEAVSSTTTTSSTTAASNGEKRPASDDADSDTDTKKIKQEAVVKKSSTIDVGREAAMEAELRAARERALVPYDQRVASFRQMLADKKVSAFSTWEKELHKIVFDCRYLLLNSKERKQVFDKYVRERAEEERKEKKNRLQLKKNAFRQLMEEAKLHTKSSYTEFSSKHARDDRFKGIEKARDRETYFSEYIAELRKKEKEEKEKKRDQAKAEFIALLKEKGVDRRARWTDAKKKVDSDARYKAVDGGGAREDYFREYCKLLKDERKKEKEGKEKEKERDRSSKRDKKDKDRDKDSKKDKKKEKPADTEEEKQPTPPPDQWAEILGIPSEKRAKRGRKTKETDKKRRPSSDKEKSPEKEPKSPAIESKSPVKETKTTEAKSPNSSSVESPEKITKTSKSSVKETKSSKSKRSDSTSDEDDDKHSADEKNESDSDVSKSSTPEKEIHSPKRLRSSKKEQPTPEKVSPVKSPLKKRKNEDLKSPEPEEKKSKKKTEKKRRKKSEKD